MKTGAQAPKERVGTKQKGRKLFGLKMKKLLTALLYVVLLGILLLVCFSRLMRSCHQFF